MRYRACSSSLESAASGPALSILQTAGMICVLQACAGAQPPPPDVVSSELIFAQIPAGAAPVAPDELPAGSRIVRWDPADPARAAVNLTADFVAAGRPRLSPDGTRMLLIGRRRPQEALHVWEMSVQGGGASRIGSADGCVQAMYLSTMYTLGADAPYRQIGLCRQGADGVCAIYTCRTNGADLRQITFAPDGARDPFLLSDGRLLFSYTTASRVGAPRGSALFTVNTDGTDVSAFAEVPAPPAWCGMACERADGQVAYVESVLPEGWDRGGRLVAVQRTRSLRTRRVLEEGMYHTPAALPDDRLLVSRRRSDGETYGLFTLDRGELVPVYDDPAWHEIQAQPVVSRAEPEGRSSVVDHDRSRGRLYCLNAGWTGGPLADRIPSQVRLIVPHSARSREERILGTAPVEADGSFFLDIPARTPMRVQTLDADGRIIASMRHWLWVMPREGRGCIGCHEDRELAPPNRHVLALRKPPHIIGNTRTAHAANHNTVTVEVAP